MATFNRVSLRHVNSLQQPKWLAILRILLGGMLFIKGITFISDSAQLETILETSRLRYITGSNTAVWAEVIAWTNLLGGLFILTGLCTRYMSLLLLPILLAAVFFVNLPNYTINGGSEFAFSIIILVLLGIFLYEGSGKISADEYFRTYYKAGYHNVKVDV
ncbi:DoxX family protein [Filimonas effusa]|uniref:DoxX family protein n=1 Tax=Filimonas effusa TaxID=2508721 RepID=A0A4Q1DB62_9BACT|nr:DoxX family protein [Filimonas effusa]RXK86148.1 DoxX family protein [Filimonas effusa]